MMHMWTISHLQRGSNHLIDVDPLSDMNECNCNTAQELKKWGKWTSDSGPTSRELLHNPEAVTNCMLLGLSVLENVHIFYPAMSFRPRKNCPLKAGATLKLNK